MATEVTFGANRESKRSLEVPISFVRSARVDRLHFTSVNRDGKEVRVQVVHVRAGDRERVDLRRRGFTAARGNNSSPTRIPAPNATTIGSQMSTPH